ncbi:MAG TPA: AAA family ATPase [Methylibium sp.]|uniref:AAA family ATPase n=1 Tax=Methylibium sp. TaxID=2067992 RepID=UPI002DBEDE28|nr:AAA family ATPase [Methylibium sp.]HEU4460877.1 AAA family ATPase [Methylibium sp.]
MRDRDDLPVGYELVYANGSHFVLPQRAAKQWRKHVERRTQREVEALREQQKASAKELEEGKKAAEPEPSLPAFPDEPPPRWHRVLPDFAAAIRSLSEDGVKARSPDREARERLVTIGQRLAALGPDREIGRPDGWKSALADLEARMPNFRAPVALVRNALRLAEVTNTPTRIPPLLLLGPPGVGKTLFSQRLAELMAVPHATIAFDQPSAGSALRGADKFWSNSESGLLFQLVCLGAMANPVILLDELDKSAGSSTKHDLDPLAQLHGALERQTARHIKDISVDIEFDASLVTYVATANSLHGIGMPLLSRFEIFSIAPPSGDDAIEVARRLIDQVLHQLKLEDRISFDPKCAYVLARMSPRLMLRTVERLAAAALQDKQRRVDVEQVWNELEPADRPRLH